MTWLLESTGTVNVRVSRLWGGHELVEVGQRLAHGAALVFTVALLGLGCSTDEATVRPSSPGLEQGAPAPAFSYDLYGDTLGRFTYDGAALALVQRPAHLARVYADAARGDSRAQELVRELEQVFQDFGVWAADSTARLRCLTVPELIGGCLGNWSSMNEMLGHSPEEMRLREVTARAYREQAEKRGVQNRVIVAAINLLVASGIASATVGQAAATETGMVLEESVPETVAHGRMAVKAGANAAYEAALAGGRHAGTLRNYAGRPLAEIQRAIAGYERQVALHAEKIANPAKFAERWAQMSAQERAGLIGKWQKDLNRNQELADVLRGLAEAQR